MRGALTAIFLLWASLILLSASRCTASTEVGQPAPALVVHELSGQTFDLAAQRGKVIVVNFWATWCPPCRHEMPALDAFYRKYHSQGLEMIGVSVDRPRDASEVHNVMQSFSYPAAISDDAKVNDFGTPDTLPVTFVVDSKGILRAELTPEEAPLTEQGLARIVLPLLERKPANQLPSGSPSSASSANPNLRKESAGVYIATRGDR
jgi:cytochrome c biogenesis protein CcmG, thiol:disulfide interchange protein DsbE